MFNLEAILTANGVGAVLMIILLISSRMHTRSIFLDEKIFVLMVWLTGRCMWTIRSMAIVIDCVNGTSGLAYLRPSPWL